MQRRISFDEGLELFKKSSSEELKGLAEKVRSSKNPPKRVTFVLDSNPNYTNVCNVDCTFCAFYRRKGAKDSYTKSVDEVMEHFEWARKAGIQTILLQGGVHPDLKIDYFVQLVKTARERYPEIHPHFFSAPEIVGCAEASSISIREVLQALWEAGLRTIPGGGAEILSDRVKKLISPKKISSQVYIEVHETAHEIGFKTTATMMYGHLEEPEDILNHLDLLRRAQDKTRGFTCFIPWSYKSNNTALLRKVKSWAGQDAYFKILAFSRIYLDNFDHIGASWFGEGKKIGVQALAYGADDFGGTILEENVHRATGWINQADENDMIQMIREAGFEPAQRDTFYRILKTYEGVTWVDVPEAQKRREKDVLPPLVGTSLHS